jgi:hypothetical protein
MDKQAASCMFYRKKGCIMHVLTKVNVTQEKIYVILTKIKVTLEKLFGILTKINDSIEK